MRAWTVNCTRNGSVLVFMLNLLQASTTVSCPSSRYTMVYPIPMLLNSMMIHLSLSQDASRSPKRFILDKVLDPLFAVILLSLLGVLFAYAARWDHSPLHDFFSSEHWGPRFVLVICGTLISLQWSRLHNQVHIISLWSRLHNGNASAHDTIMVTKPCLPILALVPSLRRGDWMTGLDCSNDDVK